MEQYEAEQLLKQYEHALFDQFKDWGDHPSRTEEIQLVVARLRERLIKELTAHRLSTEPLTKPWTLTSGSK